MSQRLALFYKNRNGVTCFRILRINELGPENVKFSSIGANKININNVGMLVVVQLPTDEVSARIDGVEMIHGDSFTTTMTEANGTPMLLWRMFAEIEKSPEAVHGVYQTIVEMIQ